MRSARILNLLVRPAPCIPRRSFHSSSLASFSSSAGGVPPPQKQQQQPPSVSVYRSQIHDPFFNLAFEEQLFAAHSAVPASTPLGSHHEVASSFSSAFEAAPGSGFTARDHTLFLWANKPCVIMGKHQNPYKEVHLDSLRSAGVELVRRKSGGGCVYQDLGNAIFTFISRDTPDAKEKNNQLLIGALKSLGIKAEASGRNDIETILSNGTERRKISGCAFKREKGWLMHHGTMLIDVDLQALPRVLNPSKAKLLSKGVTSVAARVANLKALDGTISRERWDTALENSFLDSHQRTASSVPHYTVSDASAWLTKDAALAKCYNDLKSFEWVHGHSPAFTHEFQNRFDQWGTVDVGFTVGKGHRIDNVTVYSDALSPVMIELIQKHLSSLLGKAYGREAIESAMDAAEIEVRSTLGDEPAAHTRQMKQWLLTHL